MLLDQLGDWNLNLIVFDGFFASSQEERAGCLLSRAFCCCCCIMCCKSKEKGIIVMENLKEGGEEIYVDLKEVERTSGGGVKSSHMRMILEGLAHFHGAWMVWLRSGKDMGDMSREQLMDFYKQQAAYQWKWMWKAMIKRMFKQYIALAEHKGEQDMKAKLEMIRDSPATVNSFIKTFDFVYSMFKTVCHSDLWTGQIMIALNEDGERQTETNFGTNNFTKKLCFLQVLQRK